MQRYGFRNNIKLEDKELHLFMQPTFKASDCSIEALFDGRSLGTGLTFERRTTWVGFIPCTQSLTP